MTCSDPKGFIGPNGEQMAGPCRKCENCLKRRRRSWIGRILAEQETCDQVLFATFTYGGGYENDDAYWLNYDDLANCFKRMRNGSKKHNQPKLKFRYIAVGEYGTERERAHFHAILFIKGEMPNIKLDERVEDYYPWKHGYVQFEYPRSKIGVGVYLMDYLDKDNLIENNLRHSNVPGLGHDYLQKYAREHALNGVPLFANGPYYTIPDVKTSKGNLWTYEVNKRSAMYKHMLTTYVDTWVKARPTQRIPLSPTMEEFVIEILEDRCPDTWENYFRTNYSNEFHDEFKTMGWRIGVSDHGYCLSIYDNLSVKVSVTNDYGEEIWYSGLSAEKTEGILRLERIEPVVKIERPEQIEQHASLIISHIHHLRARNLVRSFIEKNRSTPPKPPSLTQTM